jgi:cytidine deaminase
MPHLESPVLKELIARAKQVCSQAYCPYSHFPVGAAVLTESGRIFAGCNVENASYGLAICAERNAVFQMVTHGREKIAAVVIYTPTLQATAPCGACRQVLNEFGPDAQVISVCDGDSQIATALAILLPDSFGPGSLSPGSLA